MYIGINLPAKHQTPVNAALDHGYDFITSRITTSSYRRKIQALLANSPQTVPRVPAPFDEDLSLQPQSHVGQTVALAAPWSEIDAKDQSVAQTSAQVLMHEIEYAQFCGITFVVVPGPRRRTHITRYSRAIALLLRKAPKVTILIHTTLTEEFTDTGAPPADFFSTWHVWESVWTLCGRPETLKLALEVPSHPLPQFVIDRWVCEPVAMLVLSGAGIFVPNAKNYPVLPKATQQLVLRFFETDKPFVLLKDVEGHDDAHLIYTRHLLSKSGQTSESIYAKGLENVLQLPLQPQGDNLENATYEVFENDVFKYQQYQMAISKALVSLNLPDITVFVLGAGRGALVDRVLTAAKENNINVLVHAVEKNPGAVAVLKSGQRHKWGEMVKVHIGDARTWAPPHRADLIVSEMLGSFGDNELSPEVLLPLQSAIEPHAIMIPNNHTSWIVPMFSPILYEKSVQEGSNQPYVVCITKGQRLSEPQPVWTFEYPGLEQGGLERSKRLTFNIQHASTVHGFAGYFETRLFDDVEMSTLPFTSNRPLSWFPMWFPLETPLSATDDSEVEITMWRTSDASGVAYEWCAEVYTRENGRRIRVGGGSIQNMVGPHQTKWR